MKKKTVIASLLTVFILAVSLSSGFAQKIDVTGKWNLKVETSAGSGTPVFNLKQQGDSITGTYSGQLGEAPVKGSIKNKEIRLEFKGGEIAVVYTGTVDGNSMKGKAVLGDVAEGTFTGIKEVK